MELYIVRHGRTEWNEAGLIQGTSDTMLLPEGIEMAIKTGEGLRETSFDAVYSSPLFRAVETARLIMMDREEEVMTDPRLIEMGFGVCEGKKFVPAEEEGGLLKGFWESPETYEAPEGGDSFHDVLKRATDFINYLEEKHDGSQRILIVAHAAMNQALMTVLENRQVKDFWKHGKQLNCAVAVAERKNGNWEIIERNRIYY